MWIDQRTDIPAWLATGIGRIVVEFSDLEWQLEDMIRILLKTDIASARIVAAGMNIRGRAKCAESLSLNLILNNFALDIRKFGDKVDKIKIERDRLAHGIYGNDAGQWCALYTSGSRTLAEFGGVSTARSLLPQREYYKRYYF